MENRYLLPNINPEPNSTCQIFPKIQTYILGAIEHFRVNFNVKKKYQNKWLNGNGENTQ
jgi:hypothetical protein